MKEFDLNHFDYHVLENLSYDDEELLSSELRKKIIKTVATNGGHLSSNLGIVDLTVAVLKVFDPEKSDIIFDVGHQCYAYKILTGRDISSLRLNGGVSGFPDIFESKFDKFESGHSGSSISAALGISAAKKAKGDASPTIVIIGDASLANGVAFEGLNSLDKDKYGKLIIILNDNNMSISKPQGAVSNFFNRVRTSVFYQNGAGRFKRIFDHSGIRWMYKAGVKAKNVVKRTFTCPNLFDNFSCVYLGPISGHSFKKMDVFLKRAASADDNVLLHVKTIKGKGYKKAEEDESGYWHSTSPFDTALGVPINRHEDYISISNLSGRYVMELMRKDPAAIIITPAMQKGSHLEPVFKKYPDRCFDAGIAEEHALDLAAGFALKGAHPILSIYSTFLQRGYDQLLNDLCRMKLSVLILVERAGLIGSDGSSHQGIFDLCMTLGMPNAEVYMPMEAYELRCDIVDYDFRSNGPRLVRLEREYVAKDSVKEENTENYRLMKCRDSDSYLICLGLEGNMIKNSVSNRLNVVLLNKLKPVNSELLDFLSKAKKIIIYDPTSVDKGYASYFLNQMIAIGFKGKFQIYALQDKFVSHKTKKEQLSEQHLLPEQVAEAINSDPDL